MTQLITGCSDCPFYEPEGRTPYCTHTGSPVKYGIWNSVRFYQLPSKFVPDGLYQGNGYSVSFKTEPIEIGVDEAYQPVTPEWCPVKMEDTTISYQPETISYQPKLVSNCCHAEMIPPHLDGAEEAGSLYAAFLCYICKKCGKTCEPTKTEL